jgi:UDPglucose 6-dehydrogenase
VHLFVVGAGYVGLTTAVGFARLGHSVTCHDVDPAKVAALAAGRTPIFEPGIEDVLREGLAAKRLRFVSEPDPPADTDAAVVCVPTPLSADGLLDTSLVESVVDRMQRALPPDRTIVVRSTMPLHGPDRLERLVGDVAGPSVVINPEFMREGRAMADFESPSRVVVGYLRPIDEPAARRIADLYAPLGAPLLVADARSVVLIKLASNVFLGAKIAFADELARLSDAIGADVAVVADGVGSDPRIGRAFLDPGPGFGGSCLPEQADAIAVETAVRGLRTPLLSAIHVSNATHRDEIVVTLDSLLPNGLEGTRIALLGLAFKANTDDVRQSPALFLGATLRARGAEVVGHDPVAAETARRADPDLSIAPTVEAAVDGADAVLVATEWEEFAALDWAALARRMRGDLVYDTRRSIDGEAVRAAGLRYVPLGRAATAGAVRLRA